ncbi:LysR substrate binding domain-containing protein [Thiobaca trueperi]|uniref:LysR substrate binding domain-containing protein n=1 Tax=Thiobaca trueperi TaxID=127458 RepID=A0A4R3N766_9GAMM|nr:LysR substrate binding domain-containing protein [Thiobaca trueperi]
MDDRSLDRWLVARDRLVLVSRTPVEHIDDTWLKAARWSVREQGSGTRSTFEETLRQRGIDPHALDIALTLPSNESVRIAVETGAGVAALPELVVARAMRTGALHALPFELAARPFFGLPRWGEGVIPVAQALWWIDIALSLGCGVLIPYLMFTRQEHRIDQMTAVWLLPVAAAEVAAVSGGLLAPHLADAQAQFVTLIASYVLWAYSVPVAFAILTILVLRMALHKLPHASMAASSWLALGPIGTGALGLLILGTEAPSILAAQDMASAGLVAAGIGVIAGTLLWGFGLWWLLLASLITIRYFRAGVPFNLGWWSYTFPLGVYTVATLKLGELYGLGFFSGLGTLLMLTPLWLPCGRLISTRNLPRLVQVWREAVSKPCATQAGNHRHPPQPPLPLNSQPARQCRHGVCCQRMDTDRQPTDPGDSP